ncbi:MAG: TIR domain-containing protein [Planctomycetaceae bacterium]|nr:TIR domain-containing protein [Planctomycetaceae bacterium]
MPPAEFAVFLSHNSRDKPFVRQVAARLQRDGIPFFLDEATLVPGELFQQPLEQALESSGSCAVFVGQEGWGAWHKLEMRAALSRLLESNGTYRVIPVRLPGAQRPANDELPSFLRQVTWVEFQEEPERDEANYQRLKAGIEGRAPGFVPPTATHRPSEATDARIVPPGLRSFEQSDHWSYLKLVPGPRAAAGFPRVVAHWKELIDQIDPDRTFRVAYWYGPSGCGKSSLVKAGLLPALAEYVLPFAIDAAVEGAETRVLAEIRKAVARLPGDLDLAAAFSWIVQNPDALAGRKLLLVLDQFEQWLHAARGQLESPLATALRACDGRNLQALLLVRDEFTVPVHRFMKLLGCEGREGLNYELIDLLDAGFAEHVLFEYGRAYRGISGEWPDQREKLNLDQRQFLQEAVRSLKDEDGKIVSVHLALFAQMLAGQPWTPQTLWDIGGVARVGRQFLEEKFDKRTASAEAQLHRPAAIRVFESLLPEVGSTIKGRMRSRGELIEASGYAERPADYAELLKLLDGNLRIITPVGEDSSQSYQLAHDYLVPSLRDWLTAKEKGTRRGRARLLLSERSAAWNNNREARHLPSLWEYLSIVSLVPSTHRNPLQQKMLATARRVHALRWGSGLALLLVAGWAISHWMSAVSRRSLEGQVVTAVDVVQNSRGAVVSYAIRDLQKLPPEMALEEVRSRYASAEEDRKLWLAYALAAYDDVDLPFLCSRIGGSAPEEAENFVAAFRHGSSAALEAIQAFAKENVKEGESEPDWRLKSRLAIVSLHLEDDHLASDICRTDERPNPIQRTLFIDEFHKWHGDVGALAAPCRGVADAALRSGICLALGGIPATPSTAAQTEAWKDVLKEWYKTASDNATHSAAGWALRQWQLEPPAVAATKEPTDGRHWFVNSLGMTLLKLNLEEEPVKFDRQFPVKKDSPIENVTLTRAFYLSDREITVGQFQDFIKFIDKAPDDEKPQDWKEADEVISPTEAHPVQLVSWYDAVLFCNWLSRDEGLPRAYERQENKAWKLVDNATGYRLPTEAEWEYACRAGTTSDYASGDDEKLLSNYAVFNTGHTEPCGTKRPNGWGLFDMHGNVWEWCQDRDGSNAGGEVSDPEGPAEASDRVFRGGGWDDVASFCRSALRGWNSPDYRRYALGFRVARSAVR